MNRRVLFLLALVPQLAFVGFLVAKGERTLAFGQHAVLRAQAHATMDPVRGRYLALDFEVAHVDPSLGPGARDPDEVGRTIHVGLWEQGDASTVFSYDFAPIDLDGVVLTGTLRTVNDQELLVDYGFDKFFIPQDGGDPSRSARHALRAVVHVDADGHGVVEDVLVDGVPYAEWNGSDRRGE